MNSTERCLTAHGGRVHATEDAKARRDLEADMVWFEGHTFCYHPISRVLLSFESDRPDDGFVRGNTQPVSCARCRGRLERWIDDLRKTLAGEL